MLTLWLAAALLGSVHAQASLPHGSKGTVVVFLSSKCPCSASHEPKLKALAREFKPLGFEFVGIHSNSDEPADVSKAHFEKAALGFEVREDEEGKLADSLGALKTPHAFVLNTEGKVLFQGGVDDSQTAESAKKQFLRDALEDIRGGREPRVAMARALGCMIKRK